MKCSVPPRIRTVISPGRWGPPTGITTRPRRPTSDSELASASGRFIDRIRRGRAGTVRLLGFAMAAARQQYLGAGRTQGPIRREVQGGIALEHSTTPSALPLRRFRNGKRVQHSVRICWPGSHRNPHFSPRCNGGARPNLGNLTVPVLRLVGREVRCVLFAPRSNRRGHWRVVRYHSSRSDSGLVWRGQVSNGCSRGDEWQTGDRL